jgi:hypothetical protein
MIEMRLPPPAQLSISELIQGARREIAQFQRRRATDDCYAYELMRRAIVLQDDLAWSGMYELYHPVVSSWILCQVPKPVGEDLEALVNEAFARFARAMTAQKWCNFACVSALLGYLKCCAKSAATDYHRWGQPRQHEDSLESLSQSQEPLSDDCAESVIERLAAQELWRIVSCEAPAEEERLILILHIAHGMPPRTLQQRYPTVFPRVQDIYRIKRNVLERLQHNKELRQLLHGEPREVLCQ